MRDGELVARDAACLPTGTESSLAALFPLGQMRGMSVGLAVRDRGVAGRGESGRTAEPCFHWV